MFVDGVSAKDVDQGRLGNCWFVASVACIAQDPLLLNKVNCLNFFFVFLFDQFIQVICFI